MSDAIRIGTRDSQLALWQANQVKSLLETQGHQCELVPVKSEGDIDLLTPLYEMGVQGIFTRSLDQYLLSGKVDIAVHSMKDVPTILAKGLLQTAVLKRGSSMDILVHKGDCSFMNDEHSFARIATSSIRRMAQWKRRFPNHEICSLRGNVNTRLRKLESENWDAAIFAQAGLERINLLPKNSIVLDWMLPAPAQGAIVIVAREDDLKIQDKCSSLNDPETALCTQLEKTFLRSLMGGCSTPIGAIAIKVNNQIDFKGNILSPDGSKEMMISETLIPGKEMETVIRLAENLIALGARDLISNHAND